MHKVSPGASDKSYGIHVARIAELPDGVTSRARELLMQFETNGTRQTGGNTHSPQIDTSGEPTNAKYDGLIAKLEKIEINELSPIQALVALSELKDQL